MKKFEVEIEGCSPLLFNRFTGGADLEPTKKKVITTKATAVEDKLYTLPDGKIYMPARYIEGALVEAGKDFKGKGKGNLSKIMGSSIEINPEAMVLSNQKWTDDIQVGVNPMTRGRMVIHRPRFDNWGTKFTLTLMEDGIPPERMKEIIDRAGLYVGVGDWRPAKKGKYGKFIVTSFKEV